jgi:prephenate dehydratase
MAAHPSAMNPAVIDSQFSSIERVRTLGPAGTNCEAASRHWLATRGIEAEICLHETLESAMELTLQERGTALLGCVVYPDLHNLVFPYLSRMRLADVFLFNTFNMILATRPGHRDFALVATHPAPQALVKDDFPIVFATSNSEAARMCATEEVDACITTLPAAEANGLEMIRDFGEVPMGFTIHVQSR